MFEMPLVKLSMTLVLKNSRLLKN